MLWLICSPLADEYVPGDLKEKVLSEWAHVRGVDVDAELNNPVKQMAVVVSGDHGAVYIDMIGNLEAEENAGGAGGAVVPPGPGTANVSIRNQLLGLQSALLAMRQDNLEMKTSVTASVAALKVNMERSFEMLNGNVRRMALQPARRVAVPVGGGGVGDEANTGGGAATANEGEGDLAMMATATLMPTPISLHDLWAEYLLHGVGGRKPARLFSYTERGRSKHRYSRRKIVWDTVSGLVRLGHTSEIAIDRIYAVYGGQTSVTKIINALKKDKRNGTLNPNLRV